MFCVSCIGCPKPRPASLQPCNVTIDRVPLIRGLRLGQPYSRLQTAIPRTHNYDLEPNELGVRRVLLDKHFLENTEVLAGISSVALVYFNDRLVDLNIRYTSDIKWQSNLHFVAAIAERLNLPRAGWLERDPSYLVCQGFVVEVSGAEYLPTLHMFDWRLADDLTERKAEIEAKERARVKP